MLDGRGELHLRRATSRSRTLRMCFGREELSWEECGSAGSGTRTEASTLLEDRRLIERLRSKGDSRQRYKLGWIDRSINR